MFSLRCLLSSKTYHARIDSVAWKTGLTFVQKTVPSLSGPDPEKIFHLCTVYDDWCPEWQLLIILHRTYNLATEISETNSTNLIKSTYAFKLDPELQTVWDHRSFCIHECISHVPYNENYFWELRIRNSLNK